MAAGGIGRADRVERGEALSIPQRLERREARMQSEIAIQIHDVAPGHRDPGAFLVVERVTVRNDHVESVHGAALEEADENPAVRRNDGTTERRVGRTTQKEGVQPQTEQRKSTGFDENASRDGHMAFLSVIPSFRRLTASGTPARRSPGPRRAPVPGRGRSCPTTGS